MATGIINGYLSYIFFSSDRLQIVQDGDKYSVLVRNQKIPLKNLSEGEKNAIALCYFFATILKNKAEQDYFKDENFIVLDDPISSFDFHNKIGIFSFLRWILAQIYNGNLDSRVLILTHQIEAVFHLDKICADVGKNTKFWIFENHELLDFSIKKHHEYTHLVEQIYNYACESSGSDHFEHSIGNTMRKVLECFGTFCYRLGTEEISCNDNVLKLILDEKKQNHFRHLMYRLILNTESHFEYQARANPETNFFSFIGKDEKVRTAKELLVFLTLINELHVKSHLPEKNTIETIKNWEEEIFS